MTRIPLWPLMAASSLGLSTTVVSAQTVETEATSLEEIIITALPIRRTALETAQPVLVVEGETLLRSRAASLGETLARQPGVSESAFGPIASRPILRGQAGLRVQTYQDSSDTLDVGALSDDHAVALEPLLAEHIEVVRGPATLMFGNSAAAGAVNVVTRRLPTRRQTETLRGSLEARADQATDSKNIAGELSVSLLEPWQLHVDVYSQDAGNLDIPGFAWSDALRRQLAAEGEPVDESQGTLPNSDGRSDGGSLGIAWIGEQARLGISLSRHDMNYGLPGPGEEEGEPSDIRLDLTQDRIDIDGEWRPERGLFSVVRLRGARNDYEHVELEGEAVGTRYAQMGDEWRLALEHGSESDNLWRGTVGLQWRRVDFDAVGEEAFLPPSITRNLGGFIFEEVDLGRLTLEVGGRLEQQKISLVGDASNLADYEDTAVSASLATLWRASDQTIWSLQLTSSERHPTATELYADGAHLAVRRIEIGDPDLGLERGLSIDLGWRLQSGDWRTEASIFHSDYDNYIFAQPVADLDNVRVGSLSTRMRAQRAVTLGGGDEDELAIIRFEARDVEFQGAEFSTQHPELWRVAAGRIGMYFFGDYVRAKTREGADLPQIPPYRLGAEVSWETDVWRFSVDAIWHDAQNRIAANELPTDGFTLLGFSGSYRQRLERARAMWFLQAHNLLDEEARRHSSPLKDYAPLRGRSVSVGVRVQF